MRHHVQEKKKHRKLSHETIPVDILQEGASGLARPDSGYDTNANEPSMASGQAPAIDETSSVWKTNPFSERCDVLARDHDGKC